MFVQPGMPVPDRRLRADEGIGPYDRRERLYTMVRLYRIGARGRLIAAPTEHGFVTSVGAGVPDRPKPHRITNVNTNGKTSVTTVGAAACPARRYRVGLRIRPGAEEKRQFPRAGGASPSPTDRRGHFRIAVPLYRVASLRANEGIGPRGDAYPHAKDGLPFGSPSPRSGSSPRSGRIRAA